MPYGCQREGEDWSSQRYNKSCRKNTTKVVALCYNPPHFPGECPSHEHWPNRRASIHNSVERCPAQSRERQITMDSLAKNRSRADRFIDAIFASMVLISLAGLLYVFTQP